MLFKKNVQKDKGVKNTERTVIKVKTVDDIPVIKEMRKEIGNGKRTEAIIYGYTCLKDDYTRYFGAIKYGSNREFILGELNKFNIILDGDFSITDNYTIKSLIENSVYNTPDMKKSPGDKPAEKAKDETAKFFAIKKIALFYFNYYEIARFGNYKWETLDEKEIIDPVKDAYNYMDIMKLFYSGAPNGN
ncbi:hypothetical protein [Ferroplasma sp.]|uniref:hypothetical protein n=1 Tax=Ferroplasma sp. TaxID=2591003 RepID=UPI00307D3438